MAEQKHTTRAEWDQLVDQMQPTKEGTNKFLDAVRDHLDSVKPEDRALQLNYITSKLEHEHKLPQLLINAGLDDRRNVNYRATAGDTENIKYDDIKRMADKGKNGIDDVNAARQLLATAITRNFQNMDVSGWKDGKVSAYDIGNWAKKETRSLVDVGDGNKESKNEYANVITQLGSADKLRAMFGTERPNREQINKAIEQDAVKRQAFEKLGPETVDKAAKAGIIWSRDQLSAAMFLNDPKHYDRIRYSRKEDIGTVYSSSGDWVSAEKIAQSGKPLGMSQESIDARANRDKEWLDLGKKLDDQDKQLAAKEKPATKPDAAADKKVDPQVQQELEQLRKEKEQLNKKLSELDELLKALRQQKEKPAEAPQQKPPAQEAPKTQAPEAAKPKPQEPMKTPADSPKPPAQTQPEQKPEVKKPQDSAPAKQGGADDDVDRRVDELLKRLYPQPELKKEDAKPKPKETKPEENSAPGKSQIPSNWLA